MKMSEKYCNNNNSDNPLTSRRTDGGKNMIFSSYFCINKQKMKMCPMISLLSCLTLALANKVPSS